MLVSYTFQLRQYSACPPCALIITVNIFNNWYIALFIVSFLTLIPAEQFIERNAVQIINCE